MIRIGAMVSGGGTNLQAVLDAIDAGKIGVCYGIHESRFIIWEPEFGLMQYWADEMKTLWIKGIALTLFPTQNFMNSANLHLKWWEIYSWSKLWKKKGRTLVRIYMVKRTFIPPNGI